MGLFAILVSAAVAFGSVPDAVRPSIAPWDIQRQYELWRIERGQPVGQLACEPLWVDQAMLCFRQVIGKRRDWVTKAQLKAWSVDFEGLKRAVKVAGRQATRTQLKSVTVGGMNESYWLASNEGGWAAAVLLDPPSFLEVVPGPVRLAAVPAHGVVLVWTGGKADVDKILAVGVREIYASRSGAVSPLVFRWTGQKWVPFSEAVKRPNKK